MKFYLRNVSCNATNLLDKNTKTVWAEGSQGDGIGEFILLKIADKNQNSIKGLKIINGFASDSKLFLKDNRVKTLRIELFLAYTSQDM